MNLFNMLFGKKPQVKTSEFFKMLDGYTPIYTSFNGGLYEMQQTKAIINTIATDCGKAIPFLEKHNKNLEYILRHRPNPFMTTSQFIERVVTNYLCDNNSFIIPILDDYDKVIGLFPICYNQVEALDVKGKMYLRYSFTNGEQGAIEYSRVGHLKRMQHKNDLFGDNNSSLNQTLEIIHSQNQSITNALKQSGLIRFMAQVNTQLIDEKDANEQRQLFADINFKNNNNQMMIYDSRFKDIKQVDSKPIYLDEKQQSLIDEQLHDYFGVSKNVIQHKFSEDEWNAYYEGVIEPILVKLSEAITNMVYTPSQIMSHNYVYFTANRLQYMSNASKLNFASQMFDRGIISGNDVCDVWNLPHYEGGDKHYIRKEYAEVQKLDEPVVQEPLENGDENEKG